MTLPFTRARNVRHQVLTTVLYIEAIHLHLPASRLNVRVVFSFIYTAITSLLSTCSRLLTINQTSRAAQQRQYNQYIVRHALDMN